ncbi:MAG: hypothetical protein CNIPEHKO_02442 [Anaerolineales bacterium]|nr:hypothetical protein [Anaerolineales bacterium]
MRVVLDTNVFVSAVLGGKLGIILDEWKAGTFTLIVTDSVAAEYIDVINRPKFKIPSDEIVGVTDFLLDTAEFVTSAEDIFAVTADPTDNKFLEAAVAGQVDFIVSGDNHLLDLGTFREIPIIKPRQFLDHLESS